MRPRAHDDTCLPWDDLALAAQTATEYVEQLAQTRRTAPPAEVVELAARIARDAKDACEAALEICAQLRDRMEYMAGVTGVHSTAAEAWAVHKGVCQDITHLAIGALRSVGIPARYVSGYLHPRPSAEIGEMVTGESHAWVEWFCGGEWRGLRPHQPHRHRRPARARWAAAATTTTCRPCAGCTPGRTGRRSS